MVFAPMDAICIGDATATMKNIDSTSKTKDTPKITPDLSAKDAMSPATEITGSATFAL